MYYIIYPLRLLALIIFWPLFLLYLMVYVLLFKKRSTENMHNYALKLIPFVKPLYGITLVTTKKTTQELPKQAIYVSNHQSALDIVVLTHAFQPNTVVMAKDSVRYIPIFGLLFYFAKNILIRREDANKAAQALKISVEFLNNTGASLHIFPEGTRSQGKYTLGKFKAGAFHLALEAKLPIVPICISSTTNCKLGHWDNGIVEMVILDLIDTTNLTRQDLRKVIDDTHSKMLQELELVNEKHSK